MVFVFGAAQGECSKQTKMKHKDKKDETKTCLSSGMSVIDSYSHQVTWSLRDDVQILHMEG